jgi:hypothetical protein
MSDNRQERGPLDRSRVNVNEDYEVRYWSKTFGVSEEKLKKAVKQVGPIAEKVEAFLKH